MPPASGGGRCTTPPGRLAILDLDGRLATLPKLKWGDGMNSVAVAPDGTFWVVPWAGGVYIIDYDAVVGTE